VSFCGGGPQVYRLLAEEHRFRAEDELMVLERDGLLRAAPGGPWPFAGAEGKRNYPGFAAARHPLLSSGDGETSGGAVVRETKKPANRWEVMETSRYHRDQAEHCLELARPKRRHRHVIRPWRRADDRPVVALPARQVERRMPFARMLPSVIGAKAARPVARTEALL
jgi:hypothetical protein